MVQPGLPLQCGDGARHVTPGQVAGSRNPGSTKPPLRQRQRGARVPGAGDLAPFPPALRGRGGRSARGAQTGSSRARVHGGPGRGQILAAWPVVRLCRVGSYKDITHDSLSLFRLLEPRIEILVLGTGDRVERLPPAVLKQMRVCGIAVEVQDTPNACATFNFLTSEKRMAAAGLIPPRGTYTGALPLPA
ncbi:NADH dehydrogenase (ubiquinone) complex I, assembly factor 3 [Columba livia]|uniref:NADH dehydrogenase [ubiquinone] 1 alpha subcomplex assembly factor 3 n=1 Tax=Columba livia TaxID=8932 RepID=A0A2I0M9V2_COLLI|nr:NADH dehydrogenase (ubiquinone) complex I, assembly factor 3 [Columba livia]